MSSLISGTTSNIEKSSSIWGMKASLASAATVFACAALGYAFYFDYRRRNDSSFRKSLKRSKKAAAKVKAAREKEAEDKLMKQLELAMVLVKDVQYPSSVDEREKFFLENLQKGEVLARKSPEDLTEAAACLFKAVKVYPNQVDLLNILQKSLPKDLMGLLYGMLSAETHEISNKYLKSLTARFPTIRVQTENIDASDISKEPKIINLVAARKFQKGELIYTEDPGVSNLSIESMLSMKYCFNCTQELPENARGDPDKIISSGLAGDQAVFCSTACMERAMNEFYMALCPANPENPDAKVLFDYCLNENTTYPWLVAKFVARMVWKQHYLASEGGKGDKKVKESVLEEWEHFGRMKSADIKSDETIEREAEIVRSALKLAAPGAVTFLTSDRYLSLKSAFLSNSFAIVELSNSGETKKISEEKPFISVSENGIETGVGLYYLSSYLSRRGSPNAEIEFKSAPTRRQKYRQDPLKTALSPKLVLKALKDIEEGEVISIGSLEMSTSIDESSGSPSALEDRVGQ